MAGNFMTLKTDSLKSLFVKEIETKIIAGELMPGDRLPSERDLAQRMGISRSIVNSGILELESKGFVSIIPRKGTLVVDYKNEGTAQVLSSIMNYNQGKLDMKLFYSMMDTRLLIEVESARCAARNRTAEDLGFMEKLLKDVKADFNGGVEMVVDFNFRFHHRVTLASGNMVFAMIFKSFEPVCRNLIRMYFQADDFKRQSIDQHEKLYCSIVEKDSDTAAKLMEEILMRGKKDLIRLNGPVK